MASSYGAFDVGAPKSPTVARAASPAPGAFVPLTSFVPTSSPMKTYSNTPTSSQVPVGTGGTPVNAGSPYNYNATPYLQDPGNNLVNPGTGEQAIIATQNQFQNPVAGQQAALAGQAATPSAGTDYLQNSLGALNGPGAGQQYWNQVQGQFNTPQAGQTYTQNATAALDPTGAATAFYNTAMGNYGANGSYQGPNLSAQQYQATQGAFGALPLPDSADPYYDRAVQLGTQAFNQDAASRGVYGSSEALSGVGNVVSGINAARAQNQFQNQMAIDVEQRNREALLGQQAQMGDTTGINAFNAGTQATSVYGNIANNANTQQLNQYNDTTGAMNNADITANQHAQTGANIAQNVDQTNTNNYNAQTNAATAAAAATNASNQTAGGIYNNIATQNTAATTAANNAAQGAQTLHDTRMQTTVQDMQHYTDQVMGQLSDSQKQEFAGDQQAFTDYMTAQLAPYIQNGQLSQQQANLAISMAWQTIQGVSNGVQKVTS